MNFFMRVGATAAATAVAAWVMPGIAVGGVSTGHKVLTLIGVAIVIGVVNALIKPIVTFLSGCLVFLTLGLFLLVINAFMLLLSGWLANAVGLAFAVHGFWSALIGSIIISVVSGLLLAPMGGSR
ncbi:phage holin family protein [Dermatophilus congolensis]|uniref:phage holin family protein n=1 Tax=Dermatophilus congolensis TaxID=1863 RepID=UPI001AAFDE9C|nr:phage holin family protein [Dermatophilus congolensis]MBO3143511.1 phage holin family protein [Dermatophilus congolensis]MBO3152502.1 phage holin family protein [Dermatophilus congolensis]MBO3160487.1 phage holin family protein [Dermatophilus congolensis]MBO3163788.1 phage holin family protein [Dermatophilus congolensis]MBO3177334.1 phage holin family protein [Dermatophilus congolensis]